MSAKPQDHLPKRITDATAMQAANLAQKAIIDNVVVKITRILAVVKATKSFDLSGRATREMVVNYAEAVGEIERTLHLTREEVAEIRLQPEHTFPDEQVQAIITEAVDKITAVILGDGEA